jgi:hypothetical protein
LRRQHDDRQTGPGGLEALHHGHAVEPGHHQVEQHEVDGFAPRQHVEGLRAAARLKRAIAGAADHGLEQPALRWVVVDDENGLRHGPRRAGVGEAI